MPTVSLYAPAPVTLDGSGNGTARIGPIGHAEIWHPTTTSISMTGGAPTGVATCFVYCGSDTGQNNFVDSTYNVTGAASGAIEGQTVTLGEYVFAVFSNGNPGAQAVLTVNGTKDLA